jgi:hypothetical protein
MALVSGLLQYGGMLLIAEPQLHGAWPVWVSCLFIAAGYALLWRSLHDERPGQQKPAGPEPRWQQRTLHLSLAALAAYATLAIAMTVGLMTAARMAVPGANTSLLAGLRTFMVCLMALLLGWSGSRWRRAELIWLAYALMAFCTVKLLFEDVRSGSASVIAFSLFCYGLVWVLVPRFARASKAA